MNPNPPRRIGLLAVAAALVSALPGCANLWDARGGLVEQAQMTDANGASIYLFRDIDPSEVPTMELPGRLRPCCAFGSHLGVSVGKVPIAGFELANLLSVDDLGRHNYNNGVVSMGGSGGAVLSNERSGLVYTCRGGFIDIAHLRDYADWMAYFTTFIAARLETGGVVELPSEGGVRRVVLEPVPAELLSMHRVRALSLALAEYVTFRLSIFHEIITAYGWSAIDLFPEQASAFSPEDLYSNLLGIKIARSMIEVGAVGSEQQYNMNLDRWLVEVLTRLRPLDPSDAEQVLAGLDGYWWDSKRRLPDPLLVQKRNMETGPEIRPWLASDAGSPEADAALEGKCDVEAERFVMSNPTTLGHQPLSELIRLEVEVRQKDLSADFPIRDRVIDERDFPELVRDIRARARDVLGEGFDQPRGRSALTPARD